MDSGSNRRKDVLPPFESLFEIYERDQEIRSFVDHNVEVWRRINGSLPLVDRYRLEFDPIADYWFLIERRVLVAYFSQRYNHLYKPAQPMRQLAWQLFRHFDDARRAGRFGEAALPPDHPLGWRGLLPIVQEVARELAPLPEYRDLRRASRRFVLDSVAEDLLAFIEGADSTEPTKHFLGAYYRRLRWFPYLGLARLEELPERQLFFASFYGVFASTNSYNVGGAMSFAPVLQNNPASLLMDYAQRWAAGETPHQTGFNVAARHDVRNRSEYTPVVELFGFLNLDRQPFFNGAAAEYGAFTEPDDTSVVDCVARIGERTRQFLARQDQLTRRLADEFQSVLDSKALDVPIHMELKDMGPAVGSHAPTDGDISVRFARELSLASVERANKYGTEAQAAILFHLILDAVTYTRGKTTAPLPDNKVPITPPGAVRDAPAATAALDQSIGLPPSLVAMGNDALGYLRAGYHILFAGAPGTGKTTLAQIVGHAWDHEQTQVATRIAIADAPLTTVASSAWAPFHTIGGILPDKDGKYYVTKGIFIDPDERGGDWQLISKCIVLDEMNRADLDRCIGELYPLLTHSVRTVTPAGVPGVRRIHDHPRFRLIATINDASIDDIVFPISEGLARRFMRLELRGATEDEVQLYLQARSASPKSSTQEVAASVVSQLFEACRQNGKLTDSELGEHLHFGVGYFAPLGSWVAGDLRMSTQFAEREAEDQALEVLKTCLRSATRDRGYERVFRDLMPASD